MISAANKINKQAQKRAVRIGIAAPTLRCGWGDAAETIIDAVRGEKADFLVVGRCGRGRLTGLLLGSASQQAAAFVTVQGAFNWLVDNYQRLADWRSSAHRVATLLIALDELEAKEVSKDTPPSRAR
jgi:hypothetical protein